MPGVSATAQHVAGKPRNAKILQVPSILTDAKGIHWKSIGQVKRIGKKPVLTPIKPETKPKPKVEKPKKEDMSGSWLEKPMKVAKAHAVQSDASWRELMQEIGYKDKDLGRNFQSWLDDLEEPRTDTGWYPMPPLLNDGIIGSYGVKALHRKLYVSPRTTTEYASTTVKRMASV